MAPRRSILLPFGCLALYVPQPVMRDTLIPSSGTLTRHGRISYVRMVAHSTWRTMTPTPVLSWTKVRESGNKPKSVHFVRRDLNLGNISYLPGNFFSASVRWSATCAWQNHHFFPISMRLYRSFGSTYFDFSGRTLDVQLDLCQCNDINHHLNQKLAGEAPS